MPTIARNGAPGENSTIASPEVHGVAKGGHRRPEEGRNELSVSSNSGKGGENDLLRAGLPFRTVNTPEAATSWGGT